MSGPTNIIKKQLEGSSSIDTRPSRKIATPDKWHVTCDTQYEKDDSVNQWANEKVACKTVMAKTGMLKSICYAIFTNLALWAELV